MKAQQKIDLPDFGVSFTIPAGWNGEEQGDYIVLGHQTIPGIMLLSGNTSKSADELKRQAEQGLMDEGVVLRSDGEFIVRSENRVEGNYKGSFNGASVKAYAVGLINRMNSGMNVMILSEESVFSEKHKSEVNKLIGSVQFYKAKDSEATKRWKSEIMGHQLKHLSTQGGSDYMGGISGTSSKVIMNLCSDGRFDFYSNYNASFDDYAGFGHMDSTKENVGHYKIYSLGPTSYLELYFDSGDVFEYELSHNSEGNLMLNDRKFFVLELEGCQ